MSVTSPKLSGSTIVWCPEVEQAEPCKFFGEGLCPGCYSEKLWRVRRSNWKGGGKTSPRGLIRLGTYIEVTEPLYDRFKSLFPARAFFLITRGLEPESYYLRLQSDPRCLNVQISVDILRTETGATTIPDESRIAWFLSAIPKSIIRFKTLERDATDKKITKLSLKRNVEDFLALRDRLQIPRTRIMETPLRLPGVPHLAHQQTPLESAGWPTWSFIRCNSPCQGCRAENGVLGCAITPKIASRLEHLQPWDPPRATEADVRLVELAGRIKWGAIVCQALANLGSSAQTREVYAEVQRLRPEVTALTFWKTSVRQALQRVARRPGGCIEATRPDQDPAGELGWD